MGEFHGLKNKTTHMDFLHLLLLILIVILFPTKNHGCIFLMVKRNNYQGDLVEEMDGHRFPLGSGGDYKESAKRCAKLSR